jgi:hypothetical protein
LANSKRHLLALVIPSRFNSVFVDIVQAMKRALAHSAGKMLVGPRW